ncbi:O-antigen polymerase [Sphingobacterium luzhongxinii]|uniref:O-antigen polymerase n=1 Tax=Sphingobacterium luzhongxinii TaxID=2654181 RepID=UPI0013DB228B|nr:O-antigen polymerase [Sphingobacterium sp. xlx-73]
MLLLFFIVMLMLTISLIRKGSVALFFSLIITISVFGSFLIGNIDYELNFENLLLILYTLFMIVMLISPWKRFSEIEGISFPNELKLKNVTRILIAINIPVFIIFTVTTIVVMTSVSDINEFKYGEGISTDFYYNNLPFSAFFLNISLILYNSSYFLFPLHFYFLYKRKYKLSLICFVLSLNIVLYGLTFFSRAVIVQYIVMYASFYWILYKLIDHRVNKVIKTIATVIMYLSLTYFISVSVKRFTDDSFSTQMYIDNIPNDAIVRDPVIFSYLDYLSQWVGHNFELLKRYDFKTFNGQLSFQSVLNFLSQFGIIDYDYKVYMKERNDLWPNKYSYSFNGYVAYILYDFGLLGSVIFSFLYFFLIWKLRPKDNILDFKNLFLIVLLIQVPPLAIFYSQLGGIMIALILSIFFYNYFKYKIN